MNRPLENARLFTSKQYLAKAVEYGDLAKTSVGSTKREEFQELEGRFSVLAVLADNDELLQEKNAVGEKKSNDPCSRGSGSAMSWSCAYYAMEHTAS
jgi:hypothetical protein